jgi:hypothetical protein
MTTMKKKEAVCSGCQAAAKMQCPTCIKQKLPPVYFCSQECFKKNWATHKAVHVKMVAAGTGTFSFWNYVTENSLLRLIFRSSLFPMLVIPSFLFLTYIVLSKGSHWFHSLLLGNRQILLFMVS